MLDRLADGIVGLVYIARHRAQYRELFTRSRRCARCHHTDGAFCEGHKWYLEWVAMTGEHPPPIQEQLRRRDAEK